MITENIMLCSESKRMLKHLSIDQDIYVSTMLVNGAKYLIDDDPESIDKSSDYCNDFSPFTMKIDKDLKDEIKKFCKEKEIKIKDFWNEVAKIIIINNGVIDEN